MDREFTLSFVVGLAAICLASSTFLFLAPADYSVDGRFLVAFYTVGFTLSLTAAAWSFIGRFGPRLRATSLLTLLGHAVLVAVPLGLLALTGMPPQD